MKKPQLVKRDFNELEPSALSDFTDNVAKLMGDNAAKFTDPDPVLSVLQDDAKEVRDHYKASLNGNEDEKNLMDAAMEKLKLDLRSEATYVDLVAKGDEAVINLAGFKATKGETTPSQPPAKPANFTVKPGTSRGVIILELETLEFANYYTFIVGINISGISFNGNAVIVAANTEVFVLTSKKKRVVLRNMESNVAYQCMVFGSSSKAGKGVNSEVITVTTF